MKPVVMPALGMAMVEGIVREWRKQSGDVVVQGDVLLEIETDKSLFEVESPSAGTLGLLRAVVGQTVPVGQLLVRILEPGDPTDSDTADATPDVADAAAVATPAHAGAAEVRAEGGPSETRPPHALSPRQRALLKTDGAPTAAPANEATTGWTRNVIAAKVAESWRTIPHFAVVREIEATTLLAVLQRQKLIHPAVTVTDLLVRAWAMALDDARQDHQIDLGLAVATERGVAVPVIRDVLALSVSALADARRAAIGRARAGRLDAQEITDPPASTVSNLGPQGVDWFTGIIPLGQTSLLTVGRIGARVVAVEAQPVVRQTVFATVNVDHRHMDGDGAAHLLNILSEVLVDDRRLEVEHHA